MCCPKTMKHVPKGPGCPKTCKYPEGDSHCPFKYVDGCQCPSHLVQNIDQYGNVQCIPKNQCKVCRFNGRIYKEGERVTDNCRQWYVVKVIFIKIIF